MKIKTILISVSITAALAALATGGAVVGQDKYTLKVPNGLALSEFKGYEGWQTISTNHNESKAACVCSYARIAELHQSAKLSLTSEVE